MIMENEEDSVIEKQSLTFGSICLTIIHAIIGYIAIYFFKPIWSKIVKILDIKQDYWNNKT
jgi:hypothetical protein